MFHWRITKYDPRYRNPSGHFMKEEWTSYTDIGRSFGNVLFTVEDYTEIENKYIEAILLFMDCSKIQSFYLHSLEKTKKTEDFIHCSQQMQDFYTCVKEDMIVKRDMVDPLTCLILREYLWGKLYSSDMYVHFGWDYYMYIGAKYDCVDVVEKIRSSGLFVENFQSPYCED